MTRLVPFLLIIAALMFIRAPFLIGAVPNESTMGLVQKIFYFHVPAAVTTFLAVFVCGIASVIYLVRRSRAADHVAVAAAELAVLFGAMVLVTGPLWARKAWGVWWNWEDARLLSTFVMWMVFVAYLLLRRFGGPGSEVLAAAAGIFGVGARAIRLLVGQLLAHHSSDHRRYPDPAAGNAQRPRLVHLHVHRAVRRPRDSANAGSRPAVPRWTMPTWRWRIEMRNRRGRFWWASSRSPRCW